MSGRNPAAAQSGIPKRHQAVRKWFPSEFTWRLYVVVQVAALMAFAFMVLALIADGELLEYRSVYQGVDFDLANVEAKCARKPETAFDKYWDRDPAERFQECIDYETQPRLVGKELVGINSEPLALVAILFLLAFTVPFAVVRVPTWLWEGWRSDR